MKAHRSHYPMVAVTLTAAILMFSAIASGAEEKKAEPSQLFYTANHNYELRDYQKAIDGYRAVLGAGFESGSLYYNLGNAYLKTGKVGSAVLYYEKAMRLIPHDSDLKANLFYARSLVESSGEPAPVNFIIRAVNVVFGSYSLRAVIFSASVLYLILVALAAVSIVNPMLARRFRAALFIVAALFILNLSAAATRYYDERISRHGIVVDKEAECKYEPIEKSTTYYTLREGGAVIILNTRNGWRQIRRPDGKIGWVKQEAVEEV